MSNRKKNSFTSKLLALLYENIDLLPLPFETPYGWIRRSNKKYSIRNHYKTIVQLRNRGLLVTKKLRGSRTTVHLTKNGEIEALLAILLSERKVVWDKKWRIIIFDIPEIERSMRDKLRYLLKEKEFQRLQNSVFISPYPLSTHVITYLEKTGLSKFIRLIRADSLDNDTGLKKSFGLK
jgi:DNA-binding transcriptional regulator PaaX